MRNTQGLVIGQANENKPITLTMALFHSVCQQAIPVSHIHNTRAWHKWNAAIINIIKYTCASLLWHVCHEKCLFKADAKHRQLVYKDYSIKVIHDFFRIMCKTNINKYIWNLLWPSKKPHYQRKLKLMLREMIFGHQGALNTNKKAVWLPRTTWIYLKVIINMAF